jgi:hypothetical protein
MESKVKVTRRLLHSAWCKKQRAEFAMTDGSVIVKEPGDKVQACAVNENLCSLNQGITKKTLTSFFNILNFSPSKSKYETLPQIIQGE